MPNPAGPPSDHLHSEEFLASLMRRQLVLSVGCALAFVAMLLGLPLANYFLPELMATRVVGGFTLSWFLLGIGSFPAVWMISWFFIRRSIHLERKEVEEISRENGSREGAKGAYGGRDSRGGR